MVNKVHPKKQKFEFILTILPREELTEEQQTGLFKNGVEKVSNHNLYTRKGTNWLNMFLALDTLEHESSYLGLSQIPYTLVKKEIK